MLLIIVFASLICARSKPFIRKFYNISLNHAEFGSLDNVDACPPSLIDGYVTPVTKYFIYPKVNITPFYQWENNDGYCGEVSILQAGLAVGGVWMNQFNTRLLCGAQLNSIPPSDDVLDVLPTNKNYPDPNPFVLSSSLNQSGPDQWCQTFGEPNYNAQMEFQRPLPGVVSGPNDYATGYSCATNAAMVATVYDGINQSSGMAGYQEFMSWIKRETIIGNIVSIGVLIQQGTGKWIVSFATVD